MGFYENGKENKSVNKKVPCYFSRKDSVPHFGKIEVTKRKGGMTRLFMHIP